MPKIACATCALELRIVNTGAVSAEMFQGNSRIYRLWSTDKWKCPGCGFQVLSGFAQRPLAEHFDTDCEIKVNELLEKGVEVIRILT